jgi:hypothetical protein
LYGEKKRMVTYYCSACKKSYRLFIDLEDLARGLADQSKTVMEIFADRNGKPYVTRGEAELLGTEHICESCWNLMCPDDKNVYN